MRVIMYFVNFADTVRGLAVMPDLGVLSASHDGSIRLWALTGETLMEMVGHTSIVYSVDSHASGLIVSGSEDCFAKIWKDGVCVQSIEHPGCVWDAKFLENGDVVTACSDGVVRIWTVQQDRIANSVELESYFSRLSQFKISRYAYFLITKVEGITNFRTIMDVECLKWCHGGDWCDEKILPIDVSGDRCIWKRVGGLKLEDLPGLEALQVPDLLEGALLRNGMPKIGEVVDGPDDTMARPVLDGIQYDYVFDVDMEMESLSVNCPTIDQSELFSDNPYSTADKWLLKENLPLSYRQQVVELYCKILDKRILLWTHQFAIPTLVLMLMCLGESSNKSVAAVPVKPSFKHIPKKGILVFDAAQFDGILKKISEFNNALMSDPVGTIDESVVGKLYSQHDWNQPLGRVLNGTRTLLIR
ncbi:Ubiquitin homeostasis protein lub1 [Vitis vinifera]|uniref:Ubiquitin homeostasis protein lub1 n=1 Tax=Vitis vinifera TaxID=29760 RepID=A0A438EL46_VITVI|nr:Ubiquitin homeostasis protein lub1 [Vitis vinifera]